MQERINDLIEFVKDTLTIITPKTFNKFFNELSIIYTEFTFKLMLKEYTLHSKILVYHKNILICVLTISKAFEVIEEAVNIDGLDLMDYTQNILHQTVEGIKYNNTHWYNDKDTFLSYEDKMRLLLKLKDELNQN